MVGFGLGGLVVLFLVGLAGGVLTPPGQRPAGATLVSPSPSANAKGSVSPSSPDVSSTSTPPSGVVAGPGARVGAALIYDPENHGVLLFGGATSHTAPDGTNPSTSLGDTWLWNGKAWRELNVQGPPAR